MQPRSWQRRRRRRAGRRQPRHASWRSRRSSPGLATGRRTWAFLAPGNQGGSSLSSSRHGQGAQPPTLPRSASLNPPRSVRRSSRLAWRWGVSSPPNPPAPKSYDEFLAAFRGAAADPERLIQVANAHPEYLQQLEAELTALAEGEAKANPPMRADVPPDVPE